MFISGGFTRGLDKGTGRSKTSRQRSTSRMVRNPRAWLRSAVCRRPAAQGKRPSIPEPISEDERAKNFHQRGLLSRSRRRSIGEETSHELEAESVDRRRHTRFGPWLG